MRTFIAGIFIGLWSSISLAQTVVLIHGLNADRDTWYQHRTVDGLFASGFKDATGALFIPPSQQQAHSTPAATDKVFYTVNLPWHEPIETQAKVLRDVLDYIYRQRQEPLILVGHSAGGVVARFYLLTPKTVPVQGLITIASPHLGTPWAEMMWRALQSPMGDFLDMMGADLWAQADKLLWELSPSVKTNLIHWMNWQKHPNIRYVSILHSARPTAMKMDMFVPVYSQNMNNVPALRGRSEVVNLKARHELTREDGGALAWILGSFK
jgi:pimeloyl-ACP methyl ester carboxylesterase